VALMVILGIILLILGFVLAIPFLWWIGIALIVIGALLLVHPVGGNRWY